MNKRFDQKERLKRIVTLVKLKDDSYNSQAEAFDDIMNCSFFSDREKDMILFNLDDLSSVCSKLIEWTKESSTSYEE